MSVLKSFKRPQHMDNNTDRNTVESTATHIGFRGGRPKKDPESKLKGIKIYLSPGELESLDAAARRDMVPLSTYIRKCLVEGLENA